MAVPSPCRVLLAAAIAAAVILPQSRGVPLLAKITESAPPGLTRLSPSRAFQDDSIAVELTIGASAARRARVAAAAWSAAISR
jgi:hypothetical protein